MESSSCFGKYIVKSTLNSGSFGTVYLVEDAAGCKFAIKRLQDDNKKLLDKELQALKKIKGPNIVEMVEYFYDDATGLPLIVMEYCEQGDLRDFQCQKENCVFSEVEALEIFAQILEGFHKIHENGFIHRDLKERNILIKNNVAKISDFGLARQLSYGQLTRSRCWTLPYAAPEILKSTYYNYKVDIWSLGVILFRMLFNCYPFGCFGSDVAQLQGIQACFEKDKLMLSRTKKKVNREISDQLSNLLKKILVMNSESRIDFKDLYDEPLLQSYLKNGSSDESRKFYSETFDKMTLLQSMYRSIADEKEEMPEKARENMLSSTNKKQMLASKLAISKQQPIEKREEKYKVYLECLNQYFFIIEAANAFNEDPMFLQTISEELSSALQFFLIKNVLYFIRGLRDVLLSRENVFGIKNVDWPAFVASKTYANLLSNIKNDDKKWFAIFKDYYEKITSLANQQSFINIKTYITEDIETYTSLETYHCKLPDSIKLPLRATLMTCYKTFKKVVEEKPSTKNTRLAIQEKYCMGRIIGRLIVCAGWNRLYNISQTQQGTPLLPKISAFKHMKDCSFESIYVWLQEATYEQVDAQVMAIITKYFPLALNNDYDFM